MHPEQLARVSSLPTDERYDYFIRKVSDFEACWLLRLQDWATLPSAEFEKCFAIWPEREFALVMAKRNWGNYEPVEVSLTDFLDDWLPLVDNDKSGFAVFPTVDSEGLIAGPGRLAADILSECEQYE